jgi:heavy metal sensor kinase
VKVTRTSAGEFVTGVSPLRARTLRGRIALWYGAVITICLVGYSLLVGVSFTNHVRQELDHRVHEDIELAARALTVDASGAPAWPPGFLGKQIEEEEEGGHWFEVWDVAGVKRLQGGSVNPMLSTVPRADSRPRTMSSPIGAVRVKTETVRVGTSHFFVRAAVLEAPARRQVLSLLRELVAISVTVLLLGGLGGVLLANRLLGPLARMAERAGKITAEQLHERLEADGAGEELEQLRDAFNSALAQLEGSFAQLRRFTADASHEIRTPLTALRSVGEVALQGEKSKEEYREVIGTMLEEVDRLSRLADELLTLARAEAGQAHYAFEPLDLGELAAHVAERLEVLAEERDQQLVVESVPAVMISGDRGSLRQAVMNLIDNAIKYSPEGTKVTVRVTRSAATAVLEVNDAGPGIPPEHADRIFERFYRVDPSRSREVGGTGLGLSLVKLTADAHGARVEVESVPGQGSAFRMYFPLAGA